ncbi:WASH complex subunit 7-like protein [Carex littledalei]|uniref:WASH complex subunit 7-like protein n=1 Tax=Carex littledalei TaxID=544730 RepID=A0A833QLZ5_9POAL|nr:WASH complex subunit 7-like protein [Carex littledalei]
MASLLLEQQEKLRRVVDDWCLQSSDLLSHLHGNSGSFSCYNTSSSSDPIHLHVEPIDDLADVLSIIESENVGVSKFLIVVSHDCLEISRLSQMAKKNLYQQLLLFGHRRGPQEVLLEGEPQKAFGESLSLFVQLYETVDEMTHLVVNLLLQLNAVYSNHERSTRPLNSFRTINLRTVLELLGEGLSVLILLDEIVRQNGNIKSHLSLFARMLSKVKLEVKTFGVALDDLDFLDQVVENLQRLFALGFFERLVRADSPLSASLNHVMCNKKLLDAFSSCFYEGCSEILLRLDSWKELPMDRLKIIHVLALLLFSLYASGDAPNKKILKLLSDLLEKLPLIYIGGIKVFLFEILQTKYPKGFSAWLSALEVSKDYILIQKNYLIHLNKLYLRDWQVIRDALSCWAVSFQSSMHPLSEIQNEDWLRLLLKQILQGVVLAERLHVLVVSMLDLHASLEVPLKREKMKSLCHMIVSLKVIGNIFQMRGASIVQSLPHIINIIQLDIEQLILPSKVKLQSEVAKGTQASKLGFFSSLARGSKDMDTKLMDSLSLVLMSLQILGGGGSTKRQLIFSVAQDALQSIGELDVDFFRIRKLMSKFQNVSNFQSIITECVDCSFLYWRREMAQTWLSMLYMDDSKSTWIQYVLDAFSDGLWLLKLCNVDKLTLKFYEQDIVNALRNEIVTPLCRDIEADLRLHVHSTHLKGSVFVNPTKTGVRNLSWYVRMKPLRLPFMYIDVKLLVEMYLHIVFYGHSVMPNYDHKIYSEMRHLGELKYALELDALHHIERSLCPDFDIGNFFDKLEIFSARYSYIIMKQVLIENDFDGQHKKNLRIISADHVASDISMHGLKSLSLVSNLVLDFINRMLTDLNELLQHDAEVDLSMNNIGFSTLGISLQQGDLRYALRKLSIGDHELSHLEQVQSIVTRLGNVLGLLRITAAGCAHYFRNNSWSQARYSSDMSFSECCKMLGLSNDTIVLGSIVDETLTKHQQDDIIKPLSFFISFFSQKLQNRSLCECKDFFKVITDVIANMVDSRVHKEKLLRDYESSSEFNYDGFTMGVAFLLKVLGQDRSFDELNWFDSTKQKFDAVPLPEDTKRASEKSTAGSSGAISSFMLWRQSPSTLPEVNTNKGLDTRTRYQKVLEHFECTLKIARTIMT